MTEMYIAYGIDPKQASILKVLEDLIGKPIPKVNSIEKFTFGAKVVSNNVIGLGLYFRGLKKLPISIEKFHFGNSVENC